MIPAYEAATRQMFQQTAKSLEQGLFQLSANQSDLSIPTLHSISAEMKKMSEVISLLSAEVIKLRGAVDANSINQNGSVQVQSEHPPQTMDIRDEIRALCQAKRYEQAFTRAVSASNGEIVLFACKITESAEVFNGEVAISQPIMLCVLQQLGAVLVSATEAEDMKAILNWLQEIAVTIDPTDGNIHRRK